MRRYAASVNNNNNTPGMNGYEIATWGGAPQVPNNSYRFPTWEQTATDSHLASASLSVENGSRVGRQPGPQGPKLTFAYGKTLSGLKMEFILLKKAILFLGILKISKKFSFVFRADY